MGTNRFEVPHTAIPSDARCYSLSELVINFKNVIQPKVLVVVQVLRDDNIITINKSLLS